jgi:hypothetical protein
MLRYDSRWESSQVSHGLVLFLDTLLGQLTDGCRLILWIDDQCSDVLDCSSP